MNNKTQPEHEYENTQKSLVIAPASSIPRTAPGSSYNTCTQGLFLHSEIKPARSYIQLTLGTPILILSFLTILESIIISIKAATTRNRIGIVLAILFNWTNS